MLKEVLRTKGSDLLLAAMMVGWTLFTLGVLLLARRDALVVALPLLASIPVVVMVARRPPPRAWAAWAVVVLTTYGGFATLEGAIRIRCFGLDAIIHPGRYTPRGVPFERVDDPKIGFRMPSHYRGFASGQFVRTNSLGFRGPELVEQKPPGTFRVLCFGSSLTMGEGVAEGDTWPSALAAELSRRTLRPIEVMNMGVPAFSAAQVLNLADTMTERFRPDAVVIDLDPAQPLSDGTFAPPAEAPAASTIQRFSFAATALQFLTAHLQSVTDRVAARLGHPQEAVAKGSVEALDARLAALGERGRRNHFSVFVLVIRPMADFIRTRQIDPLTLKRMDSLTRRSGISFVDTFPIFAPTELPDDFIVFPGNSHPSAAANRRFATEVAKSMRVDAPD